MSAIPTKEEIKQHDPFVDIIIGLSDGLTVPFAIATGLASVAMPANTVILISLIATVIIAVVMGISGFMTGREGLAEDNHYHEGEGHHHHHHDHHHDHHHEPLSPEMEAQRKHEMELQLELHKLDKAHARKSAVNIALFYILGGVITILPYYFTATISEGLRWSVTISISGLALFGFLKAKFTGRKPIFGVILSVSVAVVLAALGYAVANVFA